MVKIIGSAKIDDYRKVVLEEGVMKSLNVKPGDSVLFFKKEHDSTLSVYKAEGAKVTSECDSPAVRHMNEQPKKIRMFAFGIAGALVLMMFAMLMNLNHLDTVALGVFVIFWILGFFGIVILIKSLDKIDAPYETQTLVTVGGPYTKNRLTGLSKLNDDGYAVSGELYVNCLFGANPRSVDVEMEYASGNKEVILTKCVKSVPGYSVYRMRFRDEGLEEGTLTVMCTFGYIGKTIVVTSEFNVKVTEGKNSNTISITEGPVNAEMMFDENLNNTEFDDALFDPTEDDDTL